MMDIKTPAFTPEGSIPREFTCDGADKNPELQISGVPSEAKSMVLIVDDPDAPGGTFLHWLLYNIDPTERIPEGTSPGTEGANDFGKTAYGGPCPPSGTHRYYFRLYALDSALELSRGAEREQVEGAMKGHVLAEAQLMGTYSRS
jgi:Raf kinase inhibitor-like YbhB/YbcL family protein